MKTKINRRSAALIVLMATGYVLLAYLFIRPQLHDILQKRNHIKTKRNELKQREEAENLRAETDDLTTAAVNKIELIQKNYFSPFLQERIMLELSNLMGQYGLEMLSVSFGSVESVSVANPEIKDDAVLDGTFGRLIKEMRGKADGANLQNDQSLVDSRQYIREALDLLRKNNSGVSGLSPEDVDYTVSRISMTVAFRTNTYEAVSGFLNAIEGKIPRFLVYALNISFQQAGLYGDAVLHFFILPELLGDI